MTGTTSCVIHGVNLIIFELAFEGIAMDWSKESASWGEYHWEYFPKAEHHSLGITLRGFGYTQALSMKPQPPQRVLDCFCFAYLLSGEGDYQSAHCPPQKVQAGDVLLSFPGAWHHYEYRPPADWREAWFAFEGLTAQNFYEKNIFNERKPILHHGKDPVLLEMFKETLEYGKALKNKEPNSFMPFFFKIFDRIFAPAIKTHLLPHDPVQILIQKIDENPTKPWEFKDEAIAHGMSYENFRKRFKEKTSLSPHRYLNRKKIHLSCRFLAEGLSVKEACEKVGLSNPFHFSRLFKNVTGRSPRTFSQSVTHLKA